MGKLPLSDSDFPNNRNHIIDYPYINELKFYEPTLSRFLQAAKPGKRKHCDDEPTHSKREVHSEPIFDHLGEESSSQSVSLETGPGSNQDTDSRDSSKLLSQHDTDSLGSPEVKALLENSATQTSSSSRISEDSESSIMSSVISIHNQLDQSTRQHLDRKLTKLIKDYNDKRSSSEDSSAAQ